MKKDLFLRKTAFCKIIQFLFLIVFITGISAFTVSAQSGTTSDPELDADPTPIAPVKIDGKSLFFVRGISSYPAQKRAGAIQERIVKAANDKSVSADSIKVIEVENYLRIYAGSEFIMNIYEVDAQRENVDKRILSMIITDRLKLAINDYREARSRPVLLKKLMYAIGALILLAVILFLFLKLIKRLHLQFEKRIKNKLQTLESKSFKLITSDQLWKTIDATSRTLKIFITIIIIGVFLNYILSLFPWTNSITAYTLKIFTDPIRTLGMNILGFLPNLAFLIVIFFVTRYILKLTKLLFAGISHGGIVIRNFDAEWAMPTFKIVRTFVLAFVIVVAYPYIPGSDSSAFKGVSVFLGVLLSLGSSSFIGNVIAGYSMTYRRAFRIGDRIKVDELVGFVEEQKLLVTRLRSLKNEEIIIPNSV